MKKHSRMAICFVFVLIFLFSVIGCAENTLSALDSRNVTEEELTLLNDPGVSENFPLKFYGSAVIVAYDLAKNREIQDMAAGAYDVIYIRTDLSLKKITDGKAVNCEVWNGTSEAIDFFMQNVNRGSEILRSRSVFARVQEVYCFESIYHNTPIYIYYVTDKGDYLLFKFYSAAEETYLVPVEEFREEMRAYFSSHGGGVDSNGVPVNGGMIPSQEELAKYKYSEQDRIKNDLLWGGIAVLLIAGVVLVVCLLRKKSKAKHQDSNKE